LRRGHLSSQCFTVFRVVDPNTGRAARPPSPTRLRELPSRQGRLRRESVVRQSGKHPGRSPPCGTKGGSVRERASPALPCGALDRLRGQKHLPQETLLQVTYYFITSYNLDFWLEKHYNVLMKALKEI
jgi:hypothetical protein